MKKLRKIQFFLFGYVVLQLSFMVLYTPLTGKFDLFPLFTWNIFRPYPEANYKIHVLLVREVNGEKLATPKELNELPASGFSHVNFYEFTGKIQRYADAVLDKKDDLRQEYQKNIEAILLETNQSVTYELQERLLKPIEYKKNKTMLRQETIYVRTIHK